MDVFSEQIRWYLLLKYIHLYFLVGEVPVEVQSTLTNGNTLRIRCDLFQLLKSFSLPFLGIVWMQTCLMIMHYHI